MHLVRRRDANTAALPLSCALTLNESHYERHYRRTYYYSPYYRNLKFRSRLAPAALCREIMRAANRSLACKTEEKREREGEKEKEECTRALRRTGAIDSRSLARRVSRIPTSSWKMSLFVVASRS